MTMARKLRIGARISGGGSNLQAILDGCDSGAISGEVVFVGSDTPGVKGLDRAKKHGVPSFVTDYRAILKKYDAGESLPVPEDFSLEAVVAKQSLFPRQADPERVRRFFTTRAVAEANLLAQMEAWPFDLLVLAGFMRNFTPYFIDRVNKDSEIPRIMNIHPALLPAFAGVDGYGDTFRYGCRVGGCTVHFIDYGEDSGPIIGQKAFPIEPSDTLDHIKEKGLALEWELYPECIELFAAGRLSVEQTAFDLPKGKKLVKNRVVIR